MLKSINKNIKFNSTDIKIHGKASEKYVDVTFTFPNKPSWIGWIPIEYRRAGLFLESNKEINHHLLQIYNYIKNNSQKTWLKEEEQFWEKEKPNAHVTKSFFDVLATGGWKCVNCELPSNPNWARRTQDLKDFGYLLSTDTNRFCSTCNKNTTSIMMIPVKRLLLTGSGYETFSPKLRKKIIKTLNNYDVYEAKNNNHLLPDHKFPEIRWDGETKEENPEDMPINIIKEKFQLLSNQRNLQKREVCRNCYQTNKRGYPFGIPFFYKGSEEWDSKIPKIGREAESGCIGCGWYDMEKWRNSLLKIIEKKN